MALQRGGAAVDDPLEWWDSLSDETVEFWQSYWRVEPWGCEWDRHCQMMSMLDVQYAAMVNPYLDKFKRVMPRMPQDFMPPDFYRVEAKPAIDIAAQLDAYAGVNR